MGGWKVWAAGIGTILGGVAQIVMAISGEGDGDWQAGYGMIMAGLAILGIGHKIEKTGA